MRYGGLYVVIELALRLVQATVIEARLNGAEPPVGERSLGHGTHRVARRRQGGKHANFSPCFRQIGDSFFN